MFSHVMLGSADIARAKAFYDPLFAAWGGPEGTLLGDFRLIYRYRGTVFMVGRPLDGETPSAGNGSTVGFELDGPEQINAWHAAGVAAGGTPVEDPPGWRERPTGNLYLAYLRDPDGNKLCALHRQTT